MSLEAKLSLSVLVLLLFACTNNNGKKTVVTRSQYSLLDEEVLNIPSKSQIISHVLYNDTIYNEQVLKSIALEVYNKNQNRKLIDQEPAKVFIVYIYSKKEDYVNDKGNGIAMLYKGASGAAPEITFNMPKQPIVGKTDSHPELLEVDDVLAKVPTESEVLGLRISNSISSIDKEDDVSKLDLSSITGINSAIAIFKIYARTVRDGNASSDKEILRLTKTLQRKAIASQIKNFPRIRNAYYKIAKNQLWEHDIDVTIGGANNTTLKLTGGYFTANANKKETQASLHEILTSLRFKQTQYRWYKGQDEYTYYTIESSKDAMLLE